jgi:hypothetical protein
LPKQPITDLLWDSQHRRGTEIQAGARAVLTPSPVHNALSTSGGRMIARMMIGMMALPAGSNFAASRIPLLVQAAIHSIPPDNKSPLTVNVLAGFAPIGYKLTRHFPNGRHIDMASAETIAEIQRRYAAAPGINLPPHYHFVVVSPRIADLGASLDSQPNVIITNNAYFSRVDGVRLLAHLGGLLSEGGSVVTTFPYGPELDRARNTMRFFKSQIGQTAITINHEDEAHEIFREAGYSRSDVWFASQQDEMNLPQPIMDLELVVIGHR